MNKLKRLAHLSTISLALFLALKTPNSSYNIRYGLKGRVAVLKTKKSALKAAFSRLKVSSLAPMALLSLTLLLEKKLYKVMLAMIAIIIYTFNNLPFSLLYKWKKTPKMI